MNVAAKVMTVGALIFAGTILCPTTTKAGTTVVACVNNSSGTIRIVTPPDTCLKNESALDLNSGGTASQPGTQVVDSAGAVIGNLAQINQVEIQINGVWLYTQISAMGFSTITTNGIDFLYTSTNCSGTAYWDASEVPGYAAIISTGGGYTGTGTVYYAEPPFQQLTINSVSQAGNCYPGTFNLRVGPATAATLTFIPPFSVQ